MKITHIILALVTSIICDSAFAQRLKGSDTVLPIGQKEAEVYMKKNKSARITVTGGGSGVGISALGEGTTDIAMSSRPIKLSEKMKLKQSGSPTTEVIIALDALAVIVHPSNKVNQLTREQLESIFTGKITNWKEVGGANLKIVVYGRESSSGTYDFFKEHVMSKKNYASSVLSMPATGAIVQSVSQTTGAIGYVGMAYIEKTTKALKISFDGGKKYVAPTVEAARAKAYPIVRPLYFYHLASSAASVKPFISFVLSPEGQAIVASEGFVKK